MGDSSFGLSGSDFWGEQIFRLCFVGMDSPKLILEIAFDGQIGLCLSGRFCVFPLIIS